MPEFFMPELETLVVDLAAIYGKIFQVAIYTSKLHLNFGPLVLNRTYMPNRTKNLSLQILALNSKFAFSLAGYILRAFYFTLRIN